jgi:hypothetical protein
MNHNQFYRAVHATLTRLLVCYFLSIYSHPLQTDNAVYQYGSSRDVKHFPLAAVSQFTIVVRTLAHALVAIGRLDVQFETARFGSSRSDTGSNELVVSRNVLQSRRAIHGSYEDFILVLLLLVTISGCIFLCSCNPTGSVLCK